MVLYSGRPPGRLTYRCNRRRNERGVECCFAFGGVSVDAAIAEEILRTVEPMAIEASSEAERLHMEHQRERQRAVELDLQQARYEASLAERRYAACDPDNRLIAAQLEKSWEATLERVQSCEARLNALLTPEPQALVPNLAGLGEDLRAAWNAPGVNMRTRQRLVRALIADIIVDVDDEAREIDLTIHWRGGQHSRLRVKKRRNGQHGHGTSEEALAVIRSMAGRWSDDHIAASLNRMGVRTGYDNGWTARRVAVVRSKNGIRAYPSSDEHGEWRIMTEAAKELGVSNHVIRGLIKDGVLPARQVVPCAPWQVRAVDLRSEKVAKALSQRRAPRCASCQGQMSMFSDG